jgi:putative FmdB family regulatory protein
MFVRTPKPARQTRKTKNTRNPKTQGARVPEYDFECQKCGEAVTIRATMKEKQNGLRCPLCGSKDLAQIFSPIGHLSGCEGSPTKAPG